MTTLDERVARDCERSGVPFHVTDDQLLDRVAALILSGEEGGGDAQPAA